MQHLEDLVCSWTGTLNDLGQSVFHHLKIEVAQKKTSLFFFFDPNASVSYDNYQKQLLNSIFPTEDINNKCDLHKFFKERIVQDETIKDLLSKFDSGSNMEDERFYEFLSQFKKDFLNQTITNRFRMNKY
ncbi:MAG: hypothetical protein CMF49_06270 [Legionellales bacterium]|nr:hypothetical protein [Legionellales bacterium]|tara:strand:- start:400 stop:789 length:390 start_codon:yes stop_codon:yes gene_type:complete